MALCADGKYCSNVWSAPCAIQCEMCAGVDAARHSALSAYWDAHNHDEEHRAFQRMVALGCASAEDTERACSEPECVALRAEERQKAGLGNLGLPIAKDFKDFKITSVNCVSGTWTFGGPFVPDVASDIPIAGGDVPDFAYINGELVDLRDEDIAAITRDVAREF